MVNCWASGCNHYSDCQVKCKFFRIPNNTTERNQWIKLLRRTEEPGPSCYVCSCHFRDGKRENGPELQLFNAEKRQAIEMQLEEQIKKKTKIREKECGSLELETESTISRGDSITNSEESRDPLEIIKSEVITKDDELSSGLNKDTIEYVGIKMEEDVRFDQPVLSTFASDGPNHTLIKKEIEYDPLDIFTSSSVTEESDSELNSNVQECAFDGEIKVGQSFDSFEDLEYAIKQFELKTFSKIAKFKSRTIKGARLKGLKRFINPNLEYVELDYKCTKSGNFVSKSKGLRQNQSSIRENCPVCLKVRVNDEGTKLVIKSMETQHNHGINQQVLNMESNKYDSMQVNDEMNIVTNDCENSMSREVVVTEDLSNISSSKLDKCNDNINYSKWQIRYNNEIGNLMNWLKRNHITSINEDSLLNYFKHLSSFMKASTLLTIYSLLRKFLRIEKSIIISKFTKVKEFVKQNYLMNGPNPGKTLDLDHVNRFIAEADDHNNLLLKVASIIGYSGSCRRYELKNMLIDDIKIKSDFITITIPKSRRFTIRNKVWMFLIKKYYALRPIKTPQRIFFLQYRNGECSKFPLSLNFIGKIPRLIATFLNLSNAHLYTRRWRCRTSVLKEDVACEVRDTIKQRFRDLLKQTQFDSSQRLENIRRDDDESLDQSIIVENIKMEENFHNDDIEASNSEDDLLDLEMEAEMEEDEVSTVSSISDDEEAENFDTYDTDDVLLPIPPYEDNHKFIAEEKFPANISNAKEIASPSFIPEDIPSKSNFAKRRKPSKRESIKKPIMKSKKLDDSSISHQTTTTSPILPDVLKQKINMKFQNIIEKVKLTLSFSLIRDNNQLVSLYTGLPSADIFLKLYTLFEKNIAYNYCFSEDMNKKVPTIDQLLLCLMKLKLNSPDEDLAFRFNVDSVTISNIVQTWLRALVEIFTDRSNYNNQEDNTSFASSTDCKSLLNAKIVLTCNETKCLETTEILSAQKVELSCEKYSEIWKFYIKIRPNGIITFVSDLVLGTRLQSEIDCSCKFDKDLFQNDLDCDELPQGMHLNIPSILNNGEDIVVKDKQSLVEAGIAVKQVIGQMKSFRILDCIPRTNVLNTKKVIQVVSALSNLQNKVECT